MPTRVLQLTGSLSSGGIENLVMNVYRKIDPDLLRFDFLISYLGGRYEKEARDLGASIFYIPSRRDGALARCRELEAFFSERGSRYDAAHLHISSFTDLSLLRAASAANIPCRIVHMHNASASGLHKTLHRLNKKRGCSLATAYIACGEAARTWGYGGTPYYKSSLIVKNGVDIARCRFDMERRNSLRSALGIEDAFVVGNVARFHEQKNHDFLVDVFAELCRMHPASCLLLVGRKDGLYQQVFNKVHSLGLDSQVIFVGETDMVADYLQAMDVFLMPSLYEGLPLALIEAQAAGLPCVVSDVISPDSIVCNGVQRVSLDETVKMWALRIEGVADRLGSDRAVGAIQVRRAGYDINDTVQTLSQLYTSGSLTQSNL